MQAIVNANDTRKDFIARRILEKAGGAGSVVGVYRLTMKPAVTTSASPAFRA